LPVDASAKIELEAHRDALHGHRRIKGLKMRVTRHFVLAAFAIIGFCSLASARHPDASGDPRPDLLPHPLYNMWSPYRADFNRPRYVGGYLAYKLSRTSQEAMSWKENHDAGRYGTHCPTPVKLYYYPKPWEVLPVGSRHNHANVNEATIVTEGAVQPNAAEVHTSPVGGH
jgi:hypothetical protein